MFAPRFGSRQFLDHRTSETPIDVRSQFSTSTFVSTPFESRAPAVSERRTRSNRPARISIAPEICESLPNYSGKTLPVP